MKRYAYERSHLLTSFQKTLERREVNSARRHLTVTSPDSVDFSSNDFLSLSKSAELRTAYLTELESTSESLPLGSGGSRLLDGNTLYAENIERDLAAFYDAPSALLFNSGFDANSAVFSCVPQLGDAIIYDEYIHASVHEGMRLSRARTRLPFDHNCVTAFEGVLQSVIDSDERFAAGQQNVFVAIESVYSMDGDVSPVKSILRTIKCLLPEGNGHLIVDEAHSTGVYGENGRGIVHELGVQNQILVRLHTFGKALSSGGAILLCHPVMRDYLINYARSLIYTTAMGLPTLAMIKTVHSMLSSGATTTAQQKVWNLVHAVHDRLDALPPSKLLKLQLARAASPILSLLTPYPRSLSKHCQEAGFVVRPIVPPTVPEGGQRVRLCLHAGNTTAQVDHLVQCILQWIQTQDENLNRHQQAKAQVKL